MSYTPGAVADQDFVCNQKVTGPSLVSDTCMSAPNRPVATGAWRARALSTRYSKSRRPSSGLAAGLKPGLVPLSVSAARVNCETSNNPPCGVLEASIHPPLTVRKYPIAQQALEEPIGLRLGIVPLDCDEDQKAPTDPADNLVFDANLGGGHPLEQTDHSLVARLRGRTRIPGS